VTAVPASERLRVLHLDHTGVAGGAEFALVRMLHARAPWSAVVLVPPGARGGIFSGLVPVVVIREHGVRQPAGVSRGGVRAVVEATGRLLVQALSTRAHRAFRTADVVDANTARSAAYGAIAAWTARTAFVVHIRDMADATALGRVGALIMTRLVLPRADGVVTDTRAALDSTAPFLRADAVTAVIPSASGLRLTRPHPRAPGPLRVGMLARIDPWKGQELLLEAFAAAFADGDERLDLAGSAPFGHATFLRHLRARAIELGVADRVTFHGHVDDVDRLLEEWDVAVQYSTRPEPLGQNVLQYLAAGRATIVADEGGPTEWVEDGMNGLRVTPRDVISLASALRLLADDERLREALGQAARRTPGLLDDAAVADAHFTFYARVRSVAGR